MDTFRQWMEVVGGAVDAMGVLIVVAGAVLAAVRFLISLHGAVEGGWKTCRQRLGQAILLGLEFLIAGDIIRTVVVAPTIQNVLLLGLIVLIRTFLSFALQLELEGRWPWQRSLAKPS